MADTFKTKLGTTRAGERSRIWIEGKRLVAHGFRVGARFRRVWDVRGTAGDSLTLIVCTESLFAQLPVAERGTVSGKGDKPIIDITGELVRSTFGAGTHVNVKYAPGRITITREA